MKILGVDTATTACSVAVWVDGEITARQFEIMERGQAERLNPMIAEVMSAAALKFASLDRIGITIGPGAFTGLRIGLATARAMGLATSVPVVGVTTFAAMAAAVPDAELEGRQLLVAVNGKRRDVFVQMFDGNRCPLGEPAALDPECALDALASGQLLIAGDGAPALRAELQSSAEAGDGKDGRIRFSSSTAPPDAVHVCALVSGHDGSGPQDCNLGPVRPLYIRPPDAKLPGNGGRRRA